MPHSPHVCNQELGSKSFAFFRLRLKHCHPGARHSSLRCASGVKRSRPTNRVGHLNKRWEESLVYEEKPTNTEKCFQHLVAIKGH